MADAVNHPAHYGGEDNPYEVIKVLEAWDLVLAKGFCWGNLIKYTARAGAKNAAIEDRQKAAWYAARLVEIEQKILAQPEPTRKIPWSEPLPPPGVRYGPGGLV
jgi:hypothetical protein